MKWTQKISGFQGSSCSEAKCKYQSIFQLV